MNDDYQLLSHYGDDYPEWGSAPRRPLLEVNMAHKGELMDSVVGPHSRTGEPMVYHILRCELCILTHVWPLPSLDDLKEYYTHQFYQQEKTDYLERYERDRAWWERCVHGPLIQQCASYHSDRTDFQLKDTKFLEIGAGPGIALDVARNEMGWRTYAIEPNRACCDALAQRGHISCYGTLEDVEAVYDPQGSQGLFDIIYLYEVLEHQPNPEAFLLTCYDLLRPQGQIVAVVPNDYNPLQLRAQHELGLAPYWLAPPQHLHYFTPKTLQLVLRRAGFTLLDMRGTYPLDLHLTRGENYIGNDALGREVHMRRMQMESQAHLECRWPEMESMYRNQIQQRIGREIVAIARKN